VQVRRQQADEFLHIVNVVVQVERAFRQRYHARVRPVGDVDIVLGQQAAHGIAQQGRVVTGQGGNQQNFGLLQASGFFFEVNQAAKRFCHDNVFADLDALALDEHGFDVELRFFVVFAKAVHQLVAGCDALRKRSVGQWGNRVGK